MWPLHRSSFTPICMHKLFTFFLKKSHFFLFGRKGFNRLFVLPARQHWLFYLAENGHIKKNSPILYAQLRSTTSFYMTLFIWPFLGRGRGTSKSNRIMGCLSTWFLSVSNICIRYWLSKWRWSIGKSITGGRAIWHVLAEKWSECL